MLSDFLAKGYESALKIASKRHDIIGIQLYDPVEEELPKVGMIRVKDSESGKESVLDTRMPGIRRKYEEWYQSHKLYMKENFQKSGLDLVRIRTDEDYIKALLKFFKKRAK